MQEVKSMTAEILFIEPFYGGSHKTWIDGIAARSSHAVSCLGLEGRYWKWRMQGGAIPLAEEFNSRDTTPDLIVASDMLDLNTFLALTRKKSSGIPVALYFHENQLTYPWSQQDRDWQRGAHRHYGLINYRSALAADILLFNSSYHKESFLGALPSLLKGYPDYQGLENIEKLREKSEVLTLGLDLARFDDFSHDKRTGTPLILWNHRWEYDKNPSLFFRVLYELDEMKHDFGIVLLGEVPDTEPAELTKAKKQLGHRILHSGYCATFDEYASWLCRCHLLPVTSNQDFFGISIMESSWCGVIPLLPKRLTYPELFPPEKFKELFYRDGFHLRELIAHHLTHEDAKLRRRLKENARCYDWNEKIIEYERLFEKIISRGGKPGQGPR